MAFTELLPTNAQAERVAAALESLQTLNIGGGIALDKLAGVNGGTLIGNGTSAAGSPTALTKQQVTGLLGVSNRNLLVNGWFQVNQRGLTTYSGDGGYTVDMWKSLISVTVYSDHVMLQGAANNFFQMLDPNTVMGLRGKTLTASAKVSGNAKLLVGLNNGSAESYLADSHYGSEVSIASVTFDVPSDCVGILVFVQPQDANPVDVYAVKLELGDVSTLANDPPADYATELAKCQRYYVKLNEYYRPVQVLADSLTFQILPPVPMRIPPTITGSVHDDWLAEITGFTISAPGWAAHNVGVLAACAKTAHGLTDAILHVEALSAEL
jgi:hypothetical protein